MIVDLLRHGSTGRPGYLDGRTDVPVDAEGWAQFRRQTRGRTWHRVVTSPLLRARECAEALSEETQVPLRIDADWAELDFGALDGRRSDEIAQDAGLAKARAAFFQNAAANPLPGGEPFELFERRIARALARLRDDASVGPILVVSHAGAMRAAITCACGIALASLWAVRLSYGTRVRLQVEWDAGGSISGEITELAPP